VEDAGTDVQVRSSSVFDVLGSESRPQPFQRRLQVDPDTEVSLDETLLTSTGNGGLFSTGYLHQRSLQTYLLNGEGVIFLLASKRQTPEYTGQQLPELNGYRAITAITPRGRSASSGMTQRIKPSRSATRTSQVSTFSRLANSSGSIMQSESRRTTRRSKFPTVPILILRLLRDTFVPLRMRNGVPQASGSSNAATSSRPVTGSLQLTPCWTQPRRGSNPLWTGASGTIRYSEGGSRCGVHQHLSRES